MIAIAGVFFFASCGNKTVVAPEEQEKPKCEFALLLEKWDTFGELNEEGQVALIAEFKAFFDECCKEKCEKEGEVICPEKQAEIDDFKAQWDDFANLDLEAQKALIEKCIEHKKECCEKKGEGEEGHCQKAE